MIKQGGSLFSAIVRENGVGGTDLQELIVILVAAGTIKNFKSDFFDISLTGNIFFLASY